VPLDAVWIAAGAVVLGAIIAAVVAIWGLYATLKAERERLDDQLKAERERLDEQLGAERARLSRQLEHDRGLTDLAELRTLLDQVMADVLMAYQAYLALTLHWQSELASPAPVEPKKLAQRIIERTNKGIAVNESALTVQVDYLRVAARLPHGHAVTEALFGFHKVAASQPRPDEPLTPEGVEAMRAS
jgi:hypothetical protein